MSTEVTSGEFSFGSGEEFIYGKLFLPKGAEKPLPTVILSHGYNSGSVYLEDAAYALAEEGAAAYCFDFRGGSANSKSGGKTENMSVRSEIWDLKAAAEKLVAEGIADERIFLYGESQGGLVSALAAAEEPDKYQGSMLLYPAFCIPDNWRGKDPSAPPFDFMGMKISGKYVSGLPDYDVFEKVKSFKKDVLIVHGTSDPIVAKEYSERLAESFPRASLSLYFGEGHGLTGTARKRWLGEIRGFLRDHIACIA